MKIRIRATKNYVEPKPGGHMSIAKLLGIMDSELIPSRYESLFSAPFCPTMTESVQLRHDSHVKATAFLREIVNGTTVSEQFPLIIVCPHVGESWDLCLKVFAGTDGLGKDKEPVYVFIGNKSMVETLEPN